MARLVVMAPLVGLLVACQPYHSLPLDRKAKEAALASPDRARIEVQAKNLKHPILRPLAINFSDGLSPDEAAVLAVLSNPDLRAARDQRALAAAQLLEAGLLPDPILAVSQDVPSGDSGAGLVTAHTAQLSLDLTAMLTRGLRRRAAKAQQQSVDLDVAWQEWQVGEAAKLSVYRLSALGPQTNLADEISKSLEEILKAIEKSAATGDAPRSDLIVAQAAFDTGRRNALSLHQAQRREQQALNALLGLSPQEQLTLEKVPKKRPWSELPSEQDLLQGLDQRLDLVAFQKGYESQDARVRLAVWSQFPTIGISLSRAQDTSNVVTKGYGVALSLPLFNRGQGLVALENASRQQLYDQYLARLFHGRSDLALILSDMKTITHMISTAEGALPSLQVQAEASDTAFKQGSLDLVSLNQARIALLAQKSVLASLQANLDELGVALEIASGRTLQPSESPK